MLEARIHCHFLPQNFNYLENFIAPITYLPTNDDQKAIEVNNQRYKIIKETKRAWLNYFLDFYEIKLIEYESEYQSELLQLETRVLNTTNTMDASSSSSGFLNHIKEYINHRISTLKKDIYDQMSSFRRTLCQNRQRSSSTKDSIDVSPEPYLNLISNPFDARQWNHLSLG